MYRPRHDPVPLLKRILAQPGIGERVVTLTLDVLCECAREEAIALCAKWIENRDDPRRVVALRFVVRPIAADPELFHRVEAIADDPKDPHFLIALESLLPWGGAKLEERLDRLRTDRRLSKEQRQAVVSLYDRAFPETAFEVSARPLKREVGRDEPILFEVTARNLTARAITIDYDRFEQFVAFRGNHANGPRVPPMPMAGCVIVRKPDPVRVGPGESWTFQVDARLFLMLRPGAYELSVGCRLPLGALQPVWEKAKHRVTIR